MIIGPKFFLQHDQHANHAARLWHFSMAELLLREKLLSLLSLVSLEVP